MLAIRSLCLMLITGIWLAGSAAEAQQSEQQIMVDRARSTVESFTTQSDMEQMRRLLGRARAVMVFPQVLKAGFIVGGEGGSGVLLGRDPQTGAWTAPAFYTMGAGSIGLQLGAEASEMILLIMNEKALRAMISNQVKLGAEASIAVGPVGTGVAAATTTNLNADIYSYTRSRGLFGGVTVEGAVIGSRDEWNRSYYGTPITSGDIVLRRKIEAPAAGPLQQALKRAEL